MESIQPLRRKHRAMGKIMFPDQRALRMLLKFGAKIHKKNNMTAKQPPACPSERRRRRVPRKKRVISIRGRKGREDVLEIADLSGSNFPAAIHVIAELRLPGHLEIVDDDDASKRRGSDLL